MIKLDQATELDVPAERAFAVVTRIEEFPDWLPGVLRAERLDVDGGSAGPGEGGSSGTGEGGGAGPGDIAAPGDSAAPGDIAAGSRFRLVSAGPGGMEIVAQGRVESIDPPRAIAISAASGLFRLAATCTIEPLGAARSRVTVAARVEPLGIARFAAGRIEEELRSAAPEALARLRAAAER